MVLGYVWGNDDCRVVEGGVRGYATRTFNEGGGEWGGHYLYLGLVEGVIRGWEAKG